MLCQQLEKDLSMPLDYLKEVQPDYQGIDLLQKRLKSWFLDSPSRIDSWCYRVDLFKKDILHYRSLRGSEAMEFLVNSVLNREFAKVVTRLASRNQS